MINSGKQKLIVICGPTGIGKTSLSLLLAKEFNGCIVGADSMQIYRYMDIGTAKPDAGELSAAPHYLIDVADPDEEFDAARYAREGRAAVSEICARGFVPFIVGGTGFYVKAILHGLFPASPVDPAIRRKIKADLQHHDRDWLYDRLGSCDPEAASRIHPNDTYRVIRALEIFEITGYPMSEYQNQHGFMENPFETLKFCLNMEREALYERINRRVDQMIENGLIDEVKALLQKGYPGDLKSMQSIGYRHMVDYINGKSTWDDTIYTLKRDTRHFAKRQLTWFRKDKEMIWKSPGDVDEIMAAVRHFLNGDTVGA
ncbi:MAG: tRNA (adenosine(37)-N6)-dimethylallyltransferase MiaA [Desulfobacteraceae bacterium]|nr:tRNA (adenosine(37)-N6)-dimethylallyltransferase MiaA [Desulfobacteraceae bacterium]MBC2756449.1 tRNA (adenosine(37)-N6)-dimethylallyltransferase MiaA [Desulfobacteraceae bacterium]MBC2763579.1 tRNA (adenosine(37)-N6)-dimethylallyltransferase MiaA [ANME-2 cluster archaeon]